jgi:vanillate O-demethylase monooxygenase subunit
MTDKTARYIYSMGMHKSYAQEGAIDAVMAVTKQGFAEDKSMIEAQQRVIDEFPHARYLSSTADRGIVLFDRLVEKLATAESNRRLDTSRRDSAR